MLNNMTKQHRIELGESIRVLRKARGMTQLELAVATSCGQSNIWRIEAGEVSVGIDVLTRIAYALGTTVKDLVSF